MLTAITRRVSASLHGCQLEYLGRVEIDVDLAAEQHRNYECSLAHLGVRVISLEPIPELPDSVFVEDPAVLLDEVAVITRMGADARRGESESLATALAQFRPLQWMSAPATLEGGDVMRIGRTLYVGISRRTNFEGAEQLASFSYRVVPVEVRGSMHLKTACTSLGGGRVLANREWIDVSSLSECEILDVPGGEPWAANVLRVGNTVLVPAAHPRTAGLLERKGLQVRTVDISELAKAEAGLTCMSLLFDAT